MKALKIVVTHVRNEEYLLQWWIPHHAKKFDFGVVIDYGSTDGSMDMFRKLVPHWQIIPSRNKDFNALNCDVEVFEIEGAIFNQLKQQGNPFAPWVVALNSTEFLIGDTNKLKPLTFRSQKFLACDIMVDRPEDEGIEPDPSKSLIEQRTYGIPLEYHPACRYNPYESVIDQIAYRRAASDSEFHKNVHFSNRVMRSMHNFNLNYMETSMYGTGRHYWSTPCEDFRILWYAYAPYTEKMLARKMAIQHQIPLVDRQAGRGPSHYIDEIKAKQRLQFHQEFITNLSDMIIELETIDNGSYSTRGKL
jgi:hypothetical protein